MHQTKKSNTSPDAEVNENEHNDAVDIGILKTKISRRTFLKLLSAGMITITFGGVARMLGSSHSSGQLKDIGMPKIQQVSAQPSPIPIPQNLRGFADLHCHPMAHLAFGGLLFWGQPDGPIEKALSYCTPFHGNGGTGLKAPLTTTFPSLFAPFANFFEETVGHLVGGYPEFDGWPKFTTRIHQQMYVDWIRSAYEGGLRLMVALAVNNETLARLFSKVENRAAGPVAVPGPLSPQNTDDAQIKLQIQALKDFVSRHSDFMEIAYSPSQAIDILKRNKLVVVLGIEVDAIGGWKNENDPSCTNDNISRYLTELYGLGVRHIFPIHLKNNAFGGTASYMTLFDTMNDLDTFFDPNNHPPIFAKENARDKGFYYDNGQVNQLGLTEKGKFAIKEMMQLGMIIEIDHMSQKSADDTLTIAEQKDYPIVAGHTFFKELGWKDGETDNHENLVSEFTKTDLQIERIRKLGGMVAVRIYQTDCKTCPNSHVNNDCAGSSKTWAQQYQYAIQKMGMRSVGIGTDFNGGAASSGPRFGTFAAYTFLNHVTIDLAHLNLDPQRTAQRTALIRYQVESQNNGVRYADPIIDYRNYRFKAYNNITDPYAPYSLEERDIWEAIAIYKSGTDPDSADQPGLPTRTPWQRGKIVNIAKGFRANSETDLYHPSWPESTFAGNAPFEQRAAFLVKTNQVPADNEDVEVKRLYPIILLIWKKWEAMEGTNKPLSRTKAGRRDFDINIDGLAHYGLLPDFLQDLKNVGLAEQDLEPLYNSAYDYIQMWSKAQPPLFFTREEDMTRLAEIDLTPKEVTSGRFTLFVRNGSPSEIMIKNINIIKTSQLDLGTFTVIDHPVLPASLTANVNNAIDITCTFSPTIDRFFSINSGKFEAFIVVQSDDSMIPELRIPIKVSFLSDHNLLREENDPRVYVIYGGAKFWIPSPEVLFSLGFNWDNVRVVPDDSLLAIPDVPVDGTILKEQSNSTIYGIFGSAKLKISSPATLANAGIPSAFIKIVPDGSLLSIPDIPKDNTLLKEKNNPTVYVMDKGQRRRIISQQSFDAYHFSQENVRVVPDGSLSTIPLGQDLPALPNTLIPIH